MQIPLFLCCIEVPDDVVWEAVHTISSDLGELRKTFCFDLVIYWLMREINA